MKCYKRGCIWLGLIALLTCQVANAATYNISQGQLPICNNWNNSWSISGTTYTCSASVNFSGRGSMNPPARSAMTFRTA